MQELVERLQILRADIVTAEEKWPICRLPAAQKHHILPVLYRKDQREFIRNRAVRRILTQRVGDHNPVVALRQ